MKTGFHLITPIIRAVIGASFALMLSACFVEPPKVSGQALLNRRIASIPHTGTMLQSCVACHLSRVPTGIVGKLNHAAAVVANQPADCATCHASTAGANWLGATFNHQNLPDANGTVAPLKTCYICHSPDVPATVVNRFDHKTVDVATDGACGTCHTQLGTSFAGAAYHRYTKSATQPNNPFSAPTTCIGCHTGDRPVGAVGNPSFDHANGGTGDCISCHSKPGVSWTGGNFAHTPKPTTCIACHTGQRPLGPVGPVPKFDHALGGGMGDCVFCHAAVPTATTPNATFAGGVFSHTPTPTTCASCHSGERPVGLVPLNPPPGTAQFDHANGGTGDCVSCHTSVAANIGVTWVGGNYKHDPKLTSCIACHASKVPSPTTLVPPGGTRDLYVHAPNFNGSSDCAKCHLAVPANLGVAWSGGNFDHLDNTGKKVTTCLQCHVGNRPTTVVNGFDHTTSGTGDCVSCHTNAGVSWAGATGFVHVSGGKIVPTTCANCHSSTDLPPPTTLLPAGATADLYQHSAAFGGTGDCYSCHTGNIANVGVKWAGGTFNHKNAAGTAITTCIPCHTTQLPSGPVGSPNPFNHAGFSSADCASCHTNPGVSWSGATYSHNPAPATCVACHSGDVPSATTAEPVGSTRDSFYHVAPFVSGTGTAITPDCATCHSSAAGKTTWAGGTFNHKTSTGGAPATCLPCHTGNRPTTVVNNFDHSVSGTGDCVSCHTNAGVSWAGGTGFVHVSGGKILPTTCASCHASTDLPAPTTLLPAGATKDLFQHAANFGGTGDCITCHTGTVANVGVTWMGGTYNHKNSAGAAITTCIPCHTKQLPVGAVGSPNLFDHAKFSTADCATCHNKPGVSWTGGTYSHNPAPTTCVACHTADQPSAVTAEPVGSTKDSFYHVSPFVSGMGTGIAPDCATCHATAVGKTTWAGGTFNHKTSAGAAPATCLPCHTGNRPTTIVNGFDHSVGGTGDCVSCHKNPGVSWAGGTGYVHVVGGKIVPTSCSTCHASTDLPAATTLLPAGATADLYQHSAAFGGTGDCITCHTGTIANVGVKWAGGTFNHKNAAGTAITTCIPCHTKQLPVGAVGSPNVFNHAGFAAADCATCHKNPGVSWTGGTFSHNPAPATCVACHAADRPAATVAEPVGSTRDSFYHVSPFVSGTGTTTTPDCATCHATAVGKTTWAGGTFNHKTSAGAAPATCLPCHTGNRPTTIVSGFNHSTSGTGDCVSCHKNPGVSWVGGLFSHTPTPSSCATCHSGTRPAATTLLPAGATRDLFQHAATFGGTGDCVTCHTQNVANIGVRWSGGFFNHKNSTGATVTTCLPCHTGNKPSGTVPNTRDGFNHLYGSDCATCHKTNIGSVWSGGVYGHKPAPTTKTCLPCHSTRFHNQGKECASCHTTYGSWSHN